jgi:hypothetical protein
MRPRKGEQSKFRLLGASCSQIDESAHRKPDWYPNSGQDHPIGAAANSRMAFSLRPRLADVEIEKPTPTRKNKKIR